MSNLSGQGKVDKHEKSAAKASTMGTSPPPTFPSWHTQPAWLLTATAQRVTSITVLCMPECNGNTPGIRRKPSHSTAPVGHQFFWYKREWYSEQTIQLLKVDLREQQQQTMHYMYKARQFLAAWTISQRLCLNEQILNICSMLTQRTGNQPFTTQWTSHVSALQM